MSVCKDKPDDLPPLDAIGLEPTDQSSFGGRPSRRPPGGPASATVSRNMIGIGIVGPGGGPFTGKSFGAGGMGDFRGPRPSSEDRFAQATRNLSGRGVPFPAPSMSRNPNQSPQMQNPPANLGRPTSARGRKRDSLRPGATPSQLSIPPVNAEPVKPLETTENRWTLSRGRQSMDENSVEFVDRKVKALLNKLTLEKFESISKQILEWANRSVNETDGHTLIQVIKLVFEKATDEATWSEMYARLCRFLMERISPDVRDDSIRNNQDGKPIAGGNLFRKYLLNRCQEDFERGWSVKEAANAAAASKAEQDKAAADAAEKAGGGEEVLYSPEYYAAQKAKRRGLGLVKFIGELFKLQMLTERIMHECIKKLLSNVENPEEEEIESLCKLLATVGQTLDNAKARGHMDIYFSRMKELASGGKISSRIQFMILVCISILFLSLPSQPFYRM
jgi:translation initiation factor 4G